MKPQLHAASSIVKGFNQTIKLFNEYFAGRKTKGTKLFPLKFMTGYELLFYSETAA